MFLLILLVLSASSSLAFDCTITSIEQIPSVLEQCTNIIVGDLEVPNDEVLEFNLAQYSSLIFKGTVKFGTSYQDQTPLLKITGNDIIIIGNPDSVLDGQGEKYWDGKGVNSATRKPVLLEIQGKNVVVEDLNILNCPQTCVRIFKGEEFVIRRINIDVSDGFENDLGVDTHGIAVSNTSTIIIETAKIYNQGDCILVQQGKSMIFNNITCHGSQGLTIRPNWEEANYIKDVEFNECSVIEGRTGISVVTSPHQAEGIISDVSYNNIEVTGILFRGIDVRQDFEDEGRPADNIEINSLNIANVHGTMTNKYVRAVYIWCGSNACDDWVWSDIDIQKAEVENACNCVPSGWSCW